jgi:hypothetical protein
MYKVNIQDNKRHNRRAKQALITLIILLSGYGWLLMKRDEPIPTVIHVFLGGGVFFAFVELMGWLSRRRALNKGESLSKSWESNEPIKSTPKGVDELLGSLFFVETEDDYWWQAVIKDQNRPVKLIMSGKERPDESALNAARALAVNWKSFLHNMQSFLSKEAERDHDNGEDIRALNILEIRFLWPNKPTCAEISFADAPSGALWSCSYENGLIAHLSSSGR